MTGPGIFPVHRTLLRPGRRLARETRGLVSRRIADRSFLRTRPLWEILDDLGAQRRRGRRLPLSRCRRGRSRPPAASSSPTRSTRSVGTAGLRPRSARSRPIACRAVPASGGDALLRSARHARRLRLAGGDPARRPRGAGAARLRQPLQRTSPTRCSTSGGSGSSRERFVGVDPADVRTLWATPSPRRYRAFDRFLGELVARTRSGHDVDGGVRPRPQSRPWSTACTRQHRHGPPGIVLLWGDAVRRGVELDEGARPRRDAHRPPSARPPAGRRHAGRVLRQALEPGRSAAAARAHRELRRVRRDAFEGSAGPDLSAEEIERLRALGYL